MILYRPVGLQELALIYDSDMKSFPARLPQQPIFYPVLKFEYARQIASEWNARSGQSAGYVTEFKVEDAYIDRFEKHTVGGSQHQEFWIPAEGLEEFNRHIIGHIKVLEAHFGDGFEGFIPEKFGLQGKNAVEQFTLLTNSYMYKRMDFYLEIRRNHKAVFLNYLFWQQYEFKNPRLKEKILQAIKEAWLKSSPQIPLPFLPPVPEDTSPARQVDSASLVNPVEENTASVEQTDSNSLVDPLDEEITFEEQANSDFGVGPVHETTEPTRQIDSQVLINPEHGKTSLPTQTASHFVRGIELGLSEKYQEAIDELSLVTEEDPSHVVAYTSLGVALHRLGEDDRALTCYETALKLDPIHAEAHYFRANVIHNRGNLREAIAGYTMAIGLNPALVEAHQKPVPQDRLTDYTGSPAEMYWIARPAQRILNLNQLLESNPQQANLFKERAAAYSRLRNYIQAIADYSSCLVIQPDNASVLHLRGLAYEQTGKFDRALDDYQRAIVIDPQLSDAYINRSFTFVKLGNSRQAIASLNEAIRLASKNPDGYFNRGVLYFQQGDFERAIEDFSYVIRLSPGDEEAYRWRGISYEQTGRQQYAIADYRQFLAISQNSRAREEIEQKLSEWNEGRQNGASIRSVFSEERQQTDQPASEELDQDFDLHSLIVALGERAVDATWFGSGVDCYGEKANELYAFTDQNEPIAGRDLLRITSGIRQTIEGDFQAFDPGANSPWVFIRAWDGSGFYVETDDAEIKQRLQTHFQAIEEVEGAQPPYAGLFIHIRSDRK